MSSLFGLLPKKRTGMTAVTDLCSTEGSGVAQSATSDARGDLGASVFPLRDRRYRCDKVVDDWKVAG